MLVLPRIGRPAALSRRDHRGVVRRDPALEDPRAAGGRQALGGEHVLDRDRDAVQRRGELPGRAARVGGRGRGERALGVDVQEGVDGAVDRGDAVQVRLGQLDAGGLAGGEGVGQVGGAALRVRAVLTARPPGSAGPGTAAARRPGRRRAPARRSGSGGRRPRGTRWSAAAGARSAGCRRPATSLIEATDSRITDSCGARWSSSASSRSIRARSARWRTSSRVISGMARPSGFWHAVHPSGRCSPGRGAVVRPRWTTRGPPVSTGACSTSCCNDTPGGPMTSTLPGAGSSRRSRCCLPGRRPGGLRCLRSTR